MHTSPPSRCNLFRSVLNGLYVSRTIVKHLEPNMMNKLSIWLERQYISYCISYERLFLVLQGFSATQLCAHSSSNFIVKTYIKEVKKKLANQAYNLQLMIGKIHGLVMDFSRK